MEFKDTLDALTDAIRSARLAKDELFHAAIEPMPDLTDGNPGTPDGSWEARDFEAWDRRARACANRSLAWRDKVWAKIGSIERENKRPVDAAWPWERLRKAFGYQLIRKPRDGDRLLTEDELLEYPCRVVRSLWGVGPGHQGPWAPDTQWGPPESLLGEFHAELPDGGQEKQPYIQDGSPARLLGRNARSFLGAPPHYLAYPPHKTFVDIREYGFDPGYWDELSGIITVQCLLVRTHALELCAWVDERIGSWESAYYPTIKIGRCRKGKRNRTLSATLAGASLPLPRKTIPDKDAERLLSLAGGQVREFDHRRYADNLQKLIPPLRGLFINHGSDTSGARYSLPSGVRIVEEQDDSVPTSKQK